MLYTCLFATRGTDLRHPLREGASDQALTELLRDVWLRRRDRYSEERAEHHGKAPRKIEMHYIGG
jgi:cyclic pyranopterin phosphate synthase